MLLLTGLLVGCGAKKEAGETSDITAESSASREPSANRKPSAQAGNEAKAAQIENAAASQIYEVSADELLAARLPADKAAQGWVRLFDGYTFVGWQHSGEANFRVEEGTIVVDEGKQGLICTTTIWGDFELTLQFNADEQTNSGVFVRTPLSPSDPSSDCYEINIAPDDNPFPTGSIVQRQKVDAEAAGPQTPGQWRTMTIVAEGATVSVSLDEKVVCQYEDPASLAPRRIGLQHNSGRVAFRDVQIRALGMTPMIDAELSQWKKYPEMEGEFTVNADRELHVDGGKTQIETRERYANFVLVSEYKIDKPNMNSGLFFRCIPGDEMMGYECQVNNDFKDDSRLSPADCGTGGIFRRQDARVVAGDNGTWSTVTLQAYENHIAAWVNGIQVSDWEDTRKPDANPRRGRRDDAGSIMIQGHDPTTDVLYRNMQIKAMQ